MFVASISKKSGVELAEHALLRSLTDSFAFDTQQM